MEAETPVRAAAAIGVGTRLGRSGAMRSGAMVVETEAPARAVPFVGQKAIADDGSDGGEDPSDDENKARLFHNATMWRIFFRVSTFWRRRRLCVWCRLFCRSSVAVTYRVVATCEAESQNRNDLTKI